MWGVDRQPSGHRLAFKFWGKRGKVILTNDHTLWSRSLPSSIPADIRFLLSLLGLSILPCANEVPLGLGLDVRVDRDTRELIQPSGVAANPAGALLFKCIAWKD